MPGTTRSARPACLVAQNIGQIYVGALVAVAVLGFGMVRGLLWTREIRFFTVAMVLALLYALGRYTPAFHLIYDCLPGVALYRRPADATFVFCALLAHARRLSRPPLADRHVAAPRPMAARR